MKTITDYLNFARWLLMFPIASVAGWNMGTFLFTEAHADTYAVVFGGVFAFVLVGVFVAPVRRKAAEILSGTALVLLLLIVLLFGSIIACGDTTYKIQTLLHIITIITAVATAYALVLFLERKNLPRTRISPPSF